MNLNPFMFVYDADIYMKSGNVVKLHRVSKLSYTSQNGEVTKLEWLSTTAASKLMYINLDQIESIVQSGWHIALRFMIRIV